MLHIFSLFLPSLVSKVFLFSICSPYKIHFTRIYSHLHLYSQFGSICLYCYCQCPSVHPYPSVISFMSANYFIFLIYISPFFLHCSGDSLVFPTPSIHLV
uniref:Secreted protein n=1 Tax=Cacopsylla melanoneura TaxID=428564 RepID=A0A8D8VRU5_9HEMI